MPWRRLIYGPVIPQAVLIGLTFSSQPYALSARSYLELPIKLGWGLLVVTHILESIYTAYLCRKHQTGFVVGVSGMNFQLQPSIR